MSKVKKAEKIKSECKIEISNIQDCPRSACKAKNRIVQGKNHGTRLRSGPVYENYAIYVSNSTANFPIYQKLGLEMKSKNINFMMLYHVSLKFEEKLVTIFFSITFL